MGNVISVKDGRRCLPIHELFSSLSEITCRVLPAAHAQHEIATSLSGSPKLSKSWKSGAFSILYTDFLPIPKKEEIVSHPERACAAGRTLHVISEREENSS
jgi:hypothetical protein